MIDPFLVALGFDVFVVECTFESENGETSNEYSYHTTIHPGTTFTAKASVYDGVSVADIRAVNRSLNERDHDWRNCFDNSK